MRDEEIQNTSTSDEWICWSCEFNKFIQKSSFPSFVILALKLLGYDSHIKHPSNHRVVIKGEQRFWKRILIVDDNEDITTTFRTGIEDSNNSINVNKRIEVHTSNDPVLALSEFKPNFYDLLLVDINMPHMNGFELCEKILAIDINIKVCFMSSDEINRKALREIYPAISVGCFIRKPVNIDFLIKRIMSELD